MTYKTATETTGYDLSTTGTIVQINCEKHLHLGWVLSTGTATDFEVEIQPEGSSNWYQVKSYSSVSSINDSVVAPAAFKVRLRNTTTANDTADAAVGGAYE